MRPRYRIYFRERNAAYVTDNNTGEILRVLFSDYNFESLFVRL